MKILNYTEFILEKKSDDENLKDQLLDYLKGKNYEDYVETLEDMMKDPKLRNLVEAGFDGTMGDLKLSFSEKVIPAANLNPTQNEIGLTQSLDYGLENPESFTIYFSPYAQIKFPIITLNGKYVIDGHHRWSQIFCFNPDAKVVCLDFKANISPYDMLKITQGSIAATTGEVQSISKQGENLYDMSESAIRKHIEKKLTEPVFLAFKTHDGKTFVNREDVVDYLTNNCQKLVKEHPLLKGAPNRGYMPQTSPEPLTNMKKNKMTYIP